MMQVIARLMATISAIAGIVGVGFLIVTWGDSWLLSVSFSFSAASCAMASFTLWRQAEWWRP